MANPGAPGSRVPPGMDWIARRLADQDREIRELRASITPSQQGLRNSIAAQDESVAQAVNDIQGNLIEIRALIDGQVAAASATAFETNFAILTTGEDRAPASIIIPDGFTIALVSLVVNVGAFNSRTSADYCYASASIAGVASRENFGLAGASGGSASFGTAKTSVLTGLAGGSITVTALLRAGGGTWTANASTRVYCEASAIFLR